jgi:hypothetical protein
VDLEMQIRAVEAARYFRCGRQRIADWVKAGHLTVAATDQHGRPLYRLGDLLDAERRTRRSPKSHRRALAFAA